MWNYSYHINDYTKKTRTEKHLPQPSGVKGSSSFPVKSREEKISHSYPTSEVQLTPVPLRLQIGAIYDNAFKCVSTRDGVYPYRLYSGGILTNKAEGLGVFGHSLRRPQAQAETLEAILQQVKWG